jgi:hypothetical protein
LFYSIPVSVSGSRITLTVPTALAAQVQAAVVLPGATWNCDTGWWNTVLLGIATDGRSRRRRDRETSLAPMIWSAFWIAV